MFLLILDNEKNENYFDKKYVYSTHFTISNLFENNFVNIEKILQEKLSNFNEKLCNIRKFFENKFQILKNKEENLLKKNFELEEFIKNVNFEKIDLKKEICSKEEYINNLNRNLQELTEEKIQKENSTEIFGTDLRKLFI